ncbi:BTB domain containing protein [Aphelenchoides avenae]|nr:BTB domain containing protein [Aphelenchus avenae]
MNHLEGCIASENVGQIVLNGQNLLGDAPPKFWESVEAHGEDLLNSNEFLLLQKDTVKTLVQRELDADEKLIYDKVVAWGRRAIGIPVSHLFVNTGSTTITEAELFPLLYLGKKYIVDSLTKVIMNHLEGCITFENVGQIVLDAQNFLGDAPPKFWESVEAHGEDLLTSNEFLLLQKDTVKKLVQRELDAEEKLIYDKVVAWAKAECARVGATFILPVKND